MKSLAFATLMAAMTASTAFAQAPSPSSNAADRPINVKFQDIKWQKIMPELGEGSPEIVILHVDSQTQATQLMIRVPKNFHVARHWHSANETTTTISGAFIVQHGDDNREELGPGSFNYMPQKRSIRGGQSRTMEHCCLSPSMALGTSTGSTALRRRRNSAVHA
jgi:quercetin dioxygenase-like cupin family protein